MTPSVLWLQLTIYRLGGGEQPNVALRNVRFCRVGKPLLQKEKRKGENTHTHTQLHKNENGERERERERESSAPKRDARH